MSILIKGMEMPREGTVVVIDRSGQVWTNQWPTRGYIRIDKAEVVEIPPHGRLIDADELEIHDAWISEAEGSSTHITFVYANDISEAPTVIEAEGEWEEAKG